VVPLAAPIHQILADGHRGAEHALPLRRYPPLLAASGPICGLWQAAALALCDVTVRVPNLLKYSVPLSYQLLLHRAIQVSSGITQFNYHIFNIYLSLQLETGEGSV